ncbi:hypothetical protein [Kaarinaea lacus]
MQKYFLKFFVDGTKNLLFTAAVLVLGCLSCGNVNAETDSAKSKPANTKAKVDSEALYHQGQREFYRKNYAKALPLLQQYIEIRQPATTEGTRLLSVIDQIGSIYLRIKQKPDAALKFFKKYEKDPRLSDAELNTIEEWIGAATDWKRFGKLPTEVKDADQLYLLGIKYFNRGSAKQKYPVDRSGNADFHIAASYFIPFIVNFDNDERIGEVLFLMGSIRRNVRIDNLYWTENFYLKEAIRRFPHTDLAIKSWEVLDEDVHFAYSGSEGDFTPPALMEMLEQYKQLATPR